MALFPMLTTGDSEKIASNLYTVNVGRLTTYTITGINIKYVDVRAGAAFTDGTYSDGYYSGVAYIDSNYKKPTSGNVQIVSASSTEVKVKTNGGGCNNAQFFIVGDDIQISTL